MQSGKAARGTLYLTVQQLIQYLAAFIFYVGVARFITQTEVGLWSILAASTAVFTTLTLLGLPVATQKYVSESYGRGDLGSAASVSRLSFKVVALFTLPTLAVLLLSPSLSTLILGGAEYTIPFILILSASAIIDIALVTILVKPLGANGAALARTAMFLTAFLLTQKILASKAQIKMDLSHFAKTMALAAIVALPLAALDYALTYSHPINPIARLILEGIFFLIVYTISLRLFKLVQRGELVLLKKALPHQLEKILNLIGSFIAHRTIQ